MILRMATPIGPEAQRSNPALEQLAPLVGQWRTTGTHPLVPGTTFHGRTSFEWHEGGAFVVMRAEIDEPEIPSAVAVVGSDDALAIFLSTCVLNPWLETLPERKREPFARAVAARLPSLEVDYVRLNLDARRG